MDYIFKYLNKTNEIDRNTQMIPRNAHLNNIYIVINIHIYIYI